MAPRSAFTTCPAHSSLRCCCGWRRGSWMWAGARAMKPKPCVATPIWSSERRDMTIVVNLDVMLARRKMRLNDLAERVGITPQNLSVLKTGRARAIRFSTLEKLCEVLDCQPGDLFAFEPNPPGSRHAVESDENETLSAL